MKQRTLRILDHLPIVGNIVKKRAGVVLFGSQFLEWYWNDPEARPLHEFGKEHPDEVLTYKLMHEILNNAKK